MMSSEPKDFSYVRARDLVSLRKQLQDAEIEGDEEKAAELRKQIEEATKGTTDSTGLFSNSVRQ